MKKSLLFVILIILLLGATVIAQESIDSELEDFVKNVEKVKNISTDRIKDIKKVDFLDLPEEVKLENIDDNNLALYQINIDSDKPIYVITASKELFEKISVDYTQRAFLAFGQSLNISKSMPLKTSSGVKSGYVMTRSGSITGLSTILTITKRSGDLPIEIIILKNSNEIGFRNAFNLKETGVYSDYDLISSDTIDFEEGDIISVIINIPNGTEVEEISTLMEIETK